MLEKFPSAFNTLIQTLPACPYPSVAPRGKARQQGKAHLPAAAAACSLQSSSVLTCRKLSGSRDDAMLLRAGGRGGQSFWEAEFHLNGKLIVLLLSDNEGADPINLEYMTMNSRFWNSGDTGHAST